MQSVRAVYIVNVTKFGRAQETPYSAEEGMWRATRLRVAAIPLFDLASPLARLLRQRGDDR
jgi:hypothetical protein